MELNIHPSAADKKFRKPICLRGHDKRVVGVDGGRCNRCKADDATARRRAGHVREVEKHLCPHGHDKRVVGTRKCNGICAECDRDRKRVHARETRARKYGVPVEMVGRDADALRLREVRAMLGLSVDDFAGRAGVARQTVRNLEAGTYKGRPSTRKKIVDAITPLMAERNRRLKNLRRS